MIDNKTFVLHITVGLNLGGAEKLIYDVVTRTDPQKFHVEVLALKHGGPVAEMLRKKGVPVTILGGCGPWDLLAFVKAFRFLRSRPIDIIHSHLYWAHVVASLFKCRAKVIWHVHETGFWMTPLWTLIERTCARRVDRFIAISNAAMTQLLKRVPSALGKVTLIPNGVEITARATVTPDEKAQLKKNLLSLSNRPVIGFVGRLDDRYKGIKTLISAARIVVKSVPNACFALIGAGKDFEELEAFVKLNGLQDAVYFLGEKENLGGFYRSFDVFVLPSHAEGLGIAILEAMEASLPVVATNVGGIPDVVNDGETGLLVPANNPERLSEALLKVLTNSTFAQLLGAQGRTRVEKHFNINDTVRKIETIYLECGVNESLNATRLPPGNHKNHQ